MASDDSNLLVVVVLTFNSAAVVARTIGAARRLDAPIFVVDSGSTDGSQEILRELGCEVVERTFKNYSDQRNWAISQVEARAGWQLHLDADEVLDDQAIGEIQMAIRSGRRDCCYLLHRRTYFMGRRLRFGGATNWHLRLFRCGTAMCEDRLYDQHFVSALPTRPLRGWLDDLNVGDLTEWTARHNRWSSLEAGEMARPARRSGTTIEARLSKDPRERRRAYKGLYYRCPPYARAALLFAYRYILQLGFLDGRVGFIYSFLWAFWFRVLVDAKLDEIKLLGDQR